ncbi:MAG: proline iminopeptidase-family hydrolase [Thermoanaerobaculia bacterium]|jgi:proline iminopeptidase
MRIRTAVASFALVAAASSPAFATPARSPAASAVYPQSEGFVDANGVLVYWKSVGRGAPLLIVHGGPGASHDYFLPHLLPLARTNRLVFIDERGSGRSERLEDARQYTVSNMVEDIEAVRRTLSLGKVHLLGHSFGGVLAQAYAFKYPRNLSSLILCSTFHTTKAINKALADMKAAMAPELRERIEKIEKEGLYGKGQPWQWGRYPDEYVRAAWAEGYFPYLYQNRPDPTYDPAPGPMMGWDVYREMWGSTGEYVVDGNLGGLDYTEPLKRLRVRTLVTVGDHDESAPWIAEEMANLVPGAKLVVFPKSGHMTFVDQPALFRGAVDDFVHRRR